MHLTDEEIIYCLSEDYYNHKGILLYRLDIEHQLSSILQAFNVLSNVEDIMIFIQNFNKENDTNYDFITVNDIFENIVKELTSKFGKCLPLHILTGESNILFMKKFEEFGDKILLTLFIRS